MQLADFILANLEPILEEWEGFARTTEPGATMDVVTLRDHAEAVLRATVQDMQSAQSPAQQADKSRGREGTGPESLLLDGASHKHGLERVASGFALTEMISEYRALRAAVVRLWKESGSMPDSLDDLVRFNESIDQSLARAVRSYVSQIDRSRQLFLGILGHDLRNPLNSIVLCSQALSDTFGDDRDTAELTAQIAASAAAMSQMMTDLLDFTAAGLGGAMPIRCNPMDLGRVCREVAGEIRAAYPTRTLGVALDGDLSGNWDAARLRQLVSNLLGNAMQHGHHTAPVDLAATADGDEVRLTVCNGGSPIPPEALATLFEPLRRMASAPELEWHRRPGSIGLGLYIAHAVVTAHGGHIEVTSTHEEGTRFTVCLPRGERVGGVRPPSQTKADKCAGDEPA